ncbi:spondin domain-containing protein [Pelomonas cellulosilytica]|uniref:Spondin domain-containing protein n=1 Tax=Pelomonas cellulosilytica TaxID=2906762 RepID=A0ABS8XYQ0_9BURK|nr:spondin domain-containing protein [Pelomonas sp. P8]MCE4554490.1 spondin domain-containing protein [Pelomonas sp. P8]
MNTLHRTTPAPQRSKAAPHRLAALGVTLAATLSLSQPAAAQASAYDITFKNLTSDAATTGAPTGQTGQRLSPPVFITHSADYTAYTVGQAAPETIWRIAEGGDRSALLNEVNALVGTSVLSVAAPLSAPLPQQDAVTVRVQADAAHHYLSFASMLGWTNDGFVGVSGLDLSAIQGSVTINLYGYDAGSEKNNEANGFLGALGLGNARDPEDGVITTHLGIRGDANAPAAWNWLPGPAASLTISAVPEPTSWALLLGGLPLLHLLRRRAHAANQT